jgi:hypothetical protein
MAKPKKPKLWDSRKPGRQVFFQTGQIGSDYDRNLDKSIKKPVPPPIWIRRLGLQTWEGLRNESSDGLLFAWGAELGEQGDNLSAFKLMTPGDQLFQLLGPTLVVGTRIRGTWRSSKLSEEIWGMPDWELVYALDNPVPYDIPKTDILAALDYGAGSIRGLMRAADEANVPKFRRLLKKRGGLP